MKYLWAVLAGMLLAGCPEQPPDNRFTEEPTVSCEIGVLPDGQISVYTRDAIYMNWFKTMVPGTSGKVHLPFDSTLFAKYYERWIEYENGTKIQVPATMNWREHRDSNPAIVKAWDIEKIILSAGNLNTLISDFKASSIWAALQEDEVENTVEWERMDWGNKGEKNFMLFVFEIRKSVIDRMHAVDPDQGELLERQFIIKNFVAILRDTLNLKNVTWNQAKNNVLNDKQDAWVDQYVIGKGSPPIQGSDTIWSTIRDYPRATKKIIFRIPWFTNQIQHVFNRNIARIDTLPQLQAVGDLREHAFQTNEWFRNWMIVRASGPLKLDQNMSASKVRETIIERKKLLEIPTSLKIKGKDAQLYVINRYLSASGE
jgi:hypothetical protein